jgi:pyocin large subunit-like protein
LTEVALKEEKASLEQILKDPKLSDNAKAVAQQSIKELDVAINVIQKSPILRDAAELGLLVADVALIGGFAATKVLNSSLVKELILNSTGKTITDEAAVKIVNNFYKEGANPPSWTPGKIQDISLNAAEHWTKHGREFPGIKSANEYVEAANKFVLNPPPSVQTFNRSNGDKLFYDPVSNTFAVQASSGMPRTMFRPDSADLYWLKQTGFTK